MALFRVCLAWSILASMRPTPWKKEDGQGKWGGRGRGSGVVHRLLFSRRVWWLYTFVYMCACQFVYVIRVVSFFPFPWSRVAWKNTPCAGGGGGALSLCIPDETPIEGSVPSFANSRFVSFIR